MLVMHFAVEGEALLLCVTEQKRGTLRLMAEGFLESGDTHRPQGVSNHKWEFRTKRVVLKAFCGTKNHTA